MTRPLKYRRAALNDIREIAQYISERSQNNLLGRAFADRLRAHCRRLAAQKSPPGMPRPELSPGLRSQKFGSYVVFFRLTSEACVIVAIIHGAQDLPAVLGARSLE